MKEGQWQGEWEGFQEQKVVKWTRVTIRNSPFPQSFSLSLFSHPAHSVQVGLFSDFWEQKRKCRIGAGRGGGVPQQQRKADCLALPAQTGEETGGHVELSYVLTCPPPPTPLNTLWRGVIVRAHKQGSRGKKKAFSSCKSAGIRFLDGDTTSNKHFKKLQTQTHTHTPLPLCEAAFIRSQ